MSGKQPSKKNRKSLNKVDFDTLLDEMHNPDFNFYTLEPEFLDQLPLYALQYCEDPKIAVQWVRYFYDYGAVSMAKDAAGCTALHWAVLRDNKEGTHNSVQLYIEELKQLHEADAKHYWQVQDYLRVEDLKGSSPVHLALDAGNIALFEYLLTQVGTPLPAGLLPRLMLATTHSVETKIALTNVFLAHQGDIQTVDETGQSALFAALEVGDVKLVDFLIKKGASLELKNLNGDTPLHVAVKKGNLELVQLLLSHKAPINAVDAQGNTALHHAILLEHTILVEPLLKKGADVNATDKDGYTPLHLAAMSKNAKVILEVIPKLCPDKKQYLPTDKAHYLALDGTGRTALHWAVSSDNVRTARHLARANPKSLSILDNRGVSPLHLAVQRGDSGMVETLLRAAAPGFDKNLKDREGNTLLHLAVMNNDIQMVNFLRSKGVDLNAQDAKGRTALHLFAEKGNFEMVSWLKEEGVKLNILDHNKKTAREVAIDAGYPSVAHHLSSWVQRRKTKLNNWAQRIFGRNAMEKSAAAITLEIERSQQVRALRMTQYAQTLASVGNHLDTSDTLLLMMAMWEEKIPYAILLQIKNAYVACDYKVAKNLVLQALSGDSGAYTMASASFTRAAKHDHANKDASRRYFDTHFAVNLPLSRKKQDNAALRRFFKELNVFSVGELKNMYDLWKSVSPEKRSELLGLGKEVFNAYRAVANRENVEPEVRYSQAPGILKANTPLPLTELNPTIQKNRAVDKTRAIEPSEFAAMHPDIPFVRGVNSKELYMLIGLLQAYLSKISHDKNGKPIKLSVRKKQQISEDLHSIVKFFAAQLVQAGAHSFGEIAATLREPAVQALFERYGVTINLEFNSINRNQLFTDAAFYANTQAVKTALHESLQAAQAAQKKAIVQPPGEALKAHQRGKIVLAEQPHTILRNSVYDLKWVGEICELSNNYALKENIMLSPERLALLHITAYVETEVQRDPYAELLQPEDDLKKIITTQYYPKMMEYLRSNVAEIYETKAEIERRVQSLLKGKQNLRSVDPETRALTEYVEALRTRLGAVGQYIEGVKPAEVLEKAVRTKVYNQVMNAKMMEIAEKVGYEVTKKHRYPPLSTVPAEERHTFFVVGEKGINKGMAAGFMAVSAANNLIDFADIIKPTIQHTGEVIGVGQSVSDKAFTHFEASMVHDLILQRHDQKVKDTDGHHALFDVETLTPDALATALAQNGQAHAVIVSKNLALLSPLLQFASTKMELQVLQTAVPLGEYPKVVLNADGYEKVAIIDHDLAKAFYGDQYQTLLQQLEEAGFEITTQAAYYEQRIQVAVSLNVDVNDYQANTMLPNVAALRGKDAIVSQRRGLDIDVRDEQDLNEEAIEVEIAYPPEIYNAEEARDHPEANLERVRAYLALQEDRRPEEDPPDYDDPERQKGLDIHSDDFNQTPRRPGSAGKV